MEYITEKMIDEANKGTYTILVKAESKYQEKNYVSDAYELVLENMGAEEANREINNIAEGLIKAMLPKDINAIGYAKNCVVIVKFFKDDKKTEELSKKRLSYYTSSVKC